MSEKKDYEVLDIGEIIRKIYSQRKFFYYRVWPITFVVASLIILCVPRYYSADLKLAPELTNSGIGGGLFGAIASAYGINLDNNESSDAISPVLYPDLLNDDNFIAGLFTIRVKSDDGTIDTDYYTYIKSYQKVAWWTSVRRWAAGVVKSLFPDQTASRVDSGRQEKTTPYHFSDKDNAVAEAIRSNISFSIDKQTAVINIVTKAQDPLIAKTLADSVQTHLQLFITKYRTNKALIDMRHYEQLLAEATSEYEKICDEYARMADANSRSVLAQYKVRLENMAKNCQLKYTNLQAIATQYQLACAKVQERTPAFTLVKGASVAQSAAGPKRMMFVLGMLFLATFAGVLWIIRKDLLRLL